MRLATALRSPRGSRRQSGFSLIEVLIALTLLGIALLLGMDLVLQNPRVVRRLDGERQAFRAMESAMEAVRAGVIPLGNSESCPNAESLSNTEACPNGDSCPNELCKIVTAVWPSTPKNRFMVSMEVATPTLPGLYPVTLTAQYSAVGHKYTKKLHTMIWAPPT
jgi:prepilin-type N-terminal cleavage/methylation domain-containing protein